MTREEAKDKAVVDAIDYFANNNKEKIRMIQKHIDVIFDEHESIVKTKDARIKEFEEFLAPKPCGICGEKLKPTLKYHCHFCARYSDLVYRSKDNA